MKGKERMKFPRWFNIIFLVIFLSACGSNGVAIPGRPTDVPLPPPLVTVQSVPDPSLALAAYLDAYKADDYNTMYNLLSKAAQDANTLENFAVYNRDALNEMSASSFDYEVQSSLVNPYSAEIAYKVTYNTALVGDIQRDIIARFVLENTEWKLQWDASLILPELAGGNALRMDYSIPARGNIYDKNGDALVAQTDAYAFSIIPGNVTEDSLGTLLSEA